MSKSSSQKQFNLTEGNILSKLLFVALPIMGTQFMQMTYNLTDMFWLGRLSSDAVAASGTAGMYIWLSQAFMMIARMGAEIGVAQHIGRGERDRARQYTQSALFLAVALGIGYGSALIFLNKPLIGFFGIKEAHVAADAAAYLAITGFATPMFFITAAVTGTFNATGNSRLPFIINSIGLVGNILLDPILIFNMNLGIEGAACATVIAQTSTGLLSLCALKWHKDRPFETIKPFVRPNGDVIRQIFKWCIPIGLENMLFTFLSMLVSRFVASWGSSAIAIQRIGSQIESLSWLLCAGLGSAFTAFVGQNYGAGKYSRIHRGYRISISCGGTWGILVTCLLFFMGGTLYGIFVDEPEIIRMGAQYMRILALCQIPASVEGVSAGAFKGMGKTLPPSMMSIGCNAFRVPLAYFLSQTALGLDGIWIGVTIGAAMRGLGIFGWYLLASRRLPKADVDVTPLPDDPLPQT